MELLDAFLLALASGHVSSLRCCSRSICTSKGAEGAEGYQFWKAGAGVRSRVSHAVVVVFRLGMFSFENLRNHRPHGSGFTVVERLDRGQVGDQRFELCGEVGVHGVEHHQQA